MRKRKLSINDGGETGDGRKDRDGIWQFAASRRGCGLSRGAQLGKGPGGPRICGVHWSIWRSDGSGVSWSERGWRENLWRDRGIFQGQGESLDRCGSAEE